MGFTGFPDEAFAFYEGLLADNSKAYWTDHKAVYESAVRTPMLELLDALGDGWGEAKLFRPYRDVRFSADKSPYKTHQGAFCSIEPGVGYYVHVDADGIYAAAGFHSHTKDQTVRYRAAVDAPGTGQALAALAAKLTKAGFELGGDRVKTRPRGVAADHPRLELMRHESLIAGRHHDPTVSSDVLKMVRGDWKALKPLVDWALTNVGPGAD
ncbi:DUF2461 domain-containing protein [Hamadaea tsunoensis]|uniref:DUF2461 domain-containing protein n=1 Tax=Hamadaea tsunoensis TaxID=53368 RepID=UPI00040E420B|nr:DUF2461 domain-containing protein [Hamadaea tsunoensis]